MLEVLFLDRRLHGLPRVRVEHDPAGLWVDPIDLAFARDHPRHQLGGRRLARVREAALAELFTSVLSLCRRAGLVRVGVVAIDGTKVQANASRTANRSYGQIAREILAEAAETDRREDELYGEARGDELPERLRTRRGAARRAAAGKGRARARA